MRDEVAADVVRVVYATQRLMFGEFHCEPGDRRWSEQNRMDEGHHIVFPGTPVRIEPDGHEPVVATSAHVMFYNRFQTYRRAVVSDRGDHCAFVLVGPEVLQEIARSKVPQLADPHLRPFPLTHAPGAAGTYLAHLSLLRHLRITSEPDELFVQERLYALVGSAVAGLFAGGRAAGEPRRAATRAAHAEVVESAKAILGTRLGECLSLEGLAGLLFVSPFELARMFRRRTGFSVHGFLVQLRLRAALERVLDSRGRLTDIAADLGFASPSHFSDSFRRVFGLTPSSARRLARSGTQTRTFLEAASSLAPGASQRAHSGAHVSLEVGMRHVRLPMVGLVVVAMLAAFAGAGSAAAQRTSGSAAARFVQRTHVLWSQSGDPGTLFGWAVSELADVNGDGVEDAIVGAVLDGPASNGAVYVYSGATGDLLYEFHGQPRDLLGYSVADAGDVNDDGVHDIAAGAQGGNRVLVFSGATGSSTPLLTLHGEQAGDAFGFAVASAGDVDGDHHADVLVGATRNDAAGVNAGRAYVFSGANGSLLYSIDGDKAGDLFGSATDGTDDLNGDGVGDLLIGARNTGHAHDGRVYAYSGANGHRIWASAPDKAAKDLGWFFVAAVGDLNHDGISDVYGGDFTYSVGGVNRGRVEIFSGVDGSVLRSWTGSSEHQGFGPGREAGDVNGDHVPDIAVGSYTSGDGAKGAGKVEIFSGATGDRLRVLTSTNAHENFGFDTVGLGDTNGDGHPDLLVSAATGSTVYLISGN